MERRLNLNFFWQLSVHVTFVPYVARVSSPREAGKFEARERLSVMFTFFLGSMDRGRAGLRDCSSCDGGPKSVRARRFNAYIPVQGSFELPWCAGPYKRKINSRRERERGRERSNILPTRPVGTFPFGSPSILPRRRQRSFWAADADADADSVASCCCSGALSGRFGCCCAPAIHCDTHAVVPRLRVYPYPASGFRDTLTAPSQDPTYLPCRFARIYSFVGSFSLTSDSNHMRIFISPL